MIIWFLIIENFDDEYSSGHDIGDAYQSKAIEKLNNDANNSEQQQETD